MNKKANTLLFVLGATIFNILCTLLFLVIGLVLISRLLSEDAQESVGQILFIVVFFAAIGGTFFIYHKLMKYFSKKVDFDKYFHPIFRPGKKPNPPKS